ncbi:MAG: RNA polymerase sigma factor FliA [Gammaproteobacteria bacterium]
MDATTTQLDFAAAETLIRSDENLVVSHLDLVERIAHKIARRLPPHVDIDDLVQAGMVGLIEATRSYDASHGASFSTFAGFRVRGAILDELRRADWAPRALRQRSREINSAAERVELRTGGEARSSDIAAELGMPTGAYQKLRFDLLATKTRSLHEATGIDILPADAFADTPSSPYHSAEANETREELARALARLDERIRDILARYYVEDQSLREIGEALGISESRVCQLHARALERLSGLLDTWKDAPRTARLTH